MKIIIHHHPRRKQPYQVEVRARNGQTIVMSERYVKRRAAERCVEMLRDLADVPLRRIDHS